MRYFCILSLILFLVGFAISASAKGKEAGMSDSSVNISEVEHIQVYKTAEGPKWSCWTSPWFTPKGHIRVSFLNITGGPADLEPSYRYEYASPEILNKHGIKRCVRWCESQDGGRTWQLINEIDASDLSNPRSRSPRFLILNDHSLLASGGIWATWNTEKNDYNRIGHAMVWEPSDDAQPQSTPVSLNNPDEMQAFWCYPKQLRDGTIVLPAYGTFDMKNPSPSTDAWLWFSTDQGKSWSEPLLLSRGIPTRKNAEPEVVELGNGDLLVVLRHSNPKAKGSGVYLNCGQIIVKKTTTGWQPGPLTSTNMRFRGFPALLRTRDGILICAGSNNQFNFSLDDGQTWTDTRKILDPKYKRHNHYPTLMELPDGRILSIYHLGNHWPYPPPEDQWIHATSFRVTR